MPHKILLLLSSRTLGVLDIVISAITISILLLCLDETVFVSIKDGLIIKYKGEFVGDITFVTNFTGVLVEARSRLVTHSKVHDCVATAALYIKGNFGTDVCYAVISMLGFLMCGVGICVCTIVRSNWALKVICVIEFIFTAMLLITGITFYSETFCVFQNAKSPNGKTNLKFLTRLIILVPIFVFFYKCIQILQLFLLDRFVVAEVPDPENEDNLQVLLDTAMEKIRSPHTSAVYLSTATRNNVLVMKNKDIEIPQEEETTKLEVPKRTKTGKKMFRKELEKTGRYTIYQDQEGKQPRDNAPEDKKRRENAPEDKKRRENAPEDKKRRENGPEDKKRRDNAPEDKKRRENGPEDQKYRDNAPENKKHRDNAPEDQKYRDNGPENKKRRENTPENKKRQETLSDEDSNETPSED